MAAPTAGPTGSATLDGTGGTIFDPAVHGEARGIMIYNTGSTNAASVSAVGVTKNASDFAPVAAGASVPLMAPKSGLLGAVFAKSASGTTINWVVIR